MVIWPRTSTRWAPSLSATPRSRRTCWSRSSLRSCRQAIPASVLRVGVEGETLADVLPKLREIYCGTIAYEIEHISDHQERVWLRHAIESGRYREPLDADESRRLLEQLTEVEGFEHYLKRQFLGQKQFSIEGLDVMVPMLDEAIELGVEAGAHEVVIGMAHRGRLNVLAHIIGRPYEEVLREFEGERTIEAVVAKEGATGDVKYHLGAVGRRNTDAGDVSVLLAANPSHLEAVDPVVEGITRAEQTDRSSRTGDHDSAIALPILIHGDASFPGQGVVAETLNLAEPRRLHDRRHAARDREQPDRVHDRSRGRALDALFQRPREGLRQPDHPRQRRRPRGGDLGDPARAGLPPAVRQRRRGRPRRLPPPRPQRGRRGRVHPAADGRANRGPPDRADAVRETPRRVGRGARRGGGSLGERDAGAHARSARGPEVLALEPRGIERREHSGRCRGFGRDRGSRPTGYASSSRSSSASPRGSP